MKDLKSIRKAHGMTQLALAEYLGVSRTLIAMCERKERKLPTKALLILQELIDQANHTPEVLNRKKQREQTSFERRLRKRIHACKLKMHRWTRELKVMKHRHARAKALQKSSLALLDQSDSDRWTWKKACQRSEEQLISYGLAAQALLEVKIIAMEAEVEALRQRIGE